MKLHAIGEALTTVLYDNVDMSLAPPDPETADIDDVADYCGIKRYSNPNLVPFHKFEEAGYIRCQDTGAEPEPPHTIIANYPIEGDERRILSNHAYADYVAENTVLADAQAAAYAYLVAGYSHAEAADALGRSRATISTHARRIKNNYADALATVQVLRDFQ